MGSRWDYAFALPVGQVSNQNLAWRVDQLRILDGGCYRLGMNAETRRAFGTPSRSTAIEGDAYNLVFGRLLGICFWDLLH